MDLLSRLSSNDLGPLAAGRAVTTIFLSPMGRILHRAHLQPLAGGGLRAAVESEVRGFPEWVDRYTFAEDFALRPLDGHAVRLLTGRELARVAPPGAMDGATVASGELLWSRRDLGDVPCCVVTGPSSELESLASTDGIAELDADGWTQLRVEQRAPAAGHELTDQHFPLEAGLLADISFTKGCYTGQEVVARQDAYSKVTRRLVGLAFAASPTEGEPLPSEEKPGCRITSVAPSASRDGQVRCLAYVHARHGTPGTEVSTASMTGRVV